MQNLGSFWEWSIVYFLYTHRGSSLLEPPLTSIRNREDYYANKIVTF